MLGGGTATFDGSQLTNDSGPLISTTVNLNNSTSAGDINVASGANGQVSISGNSALTGRLAVEQVGESQGVLTASIDTTSRLDLTGNSTLTGLTNHGTVNFVTDGTYSSKTTPVTKPQRREGRREVFTPSLCAAANGLAR
ncbi:MAG: hypothetical protein LBK76_06005 [Verrucomicrobiales bacterium]|nr:hypothetical protein [Verrucomicrobiales bacterium]